MLPEREQFVHSAPDITLVIKLDSPRTAGNCYSQPSYIAKYIFILYIYIYTSRVFYQLYDMHLHTTYFTGINYAIHC